MNVFFYPRPYYISVYFVFSSISIAAFVLGFSRRNIDNTLQQADNAFINLDTNCLGDTAVIFALLTSLTEIVNCLRVGGLPAIFQGKAMYQSAISDLVLTLPSNFISYVAFGLVGIYLNIIKGRKTFSDKKVILFILFILPYLLIKILVGYRGELLGSLLIILLGYNYNKIVPNIKPKLVIAILPIYIIMVVITSARGLIPYYIKSGDYRSLIDTALSNERILNYINPADNEFGVAFGNFNLYYQSNKGHNKHKYGESYLTGVTSVIPSFLYPGEKPQSILYEFRDKYMPYEKLRGSIASQGFSFMLEAYINFGVIGIAMIYFLVGRLFYILENNKFSKKSFGFFIYYISCIATLTTFHRSHFNYIFDSNVTLIILIIFSKAVYKVIFELKNKFVFEKNITLNRVKKEEHCVDIK